MKRILKLLFLPILSIALFAYTYTNQIQPKLGLDLQGGISVILTAEEGTDKELIEQAVEIMRTRIAAFGDVQEPEISISGENSVLVQLPGITDQEKALEAVGTTGLLTFRPVLDSSLNFIIFKQSCSSIILIRSTKRRIGDVICVYSLILSIS